MSHHDLPTAKQEFEFAIPVELLQHFKAEVRIVIRQPWVIGIPAPELLLNREVLDKLRGYDVMLVPKQILR